VSDSDKISGGRSLSSEETGRFAEMLADQGHACTSTEKQHKRYGVRSSLFMIENVFSYVRK
jgi:hypothetical protein